MENTEKCFWFNGHERFCRNKECMSVFANATFCFLDLDLSKEQHSNILVFGNVRYKR